MLLPDGGIVVTDDYRAVLAALEGGAPIVFVSGKAGTGKSTLVQWILERRPRDAAVVAPTGIAALNVGGATIHSFFRLPPRLLERSDIRRGRDPGLYKHLRLLVVDEVSMVRADLMDGIAWFLEKNGPRPGEPFGGVQLLLVGDLFQLPPVVSQEDLGTFFRRVYPSPHFFSAQALRDAEIASIELSRVFRQKDAAFAELLNKIREGTDAGEAVDELNARCFDRDGEAYGPSIVLTPTNRAADERNLEALGSLPGDATVYHGRLEGDFDDRPERLPSPPRLELKVGARVMFTKNGLRWVNGTLGVVRGCEERKVRVELEQDGARAIVDVAPTTWETIRYRWDEDKESLEKETMGRYTQLPLMLAWATTIHKAQGKTLESVELDLGRGAFAPGQLYVALSRCRELSRLRLTRPIRASDVRRDPEIARFYAALRAGGRAAGRRSLYGAAEE